MIPVSSNSLNTLSSLKRRFDSTEEGAAKKHKQNTQSSILNYVPEIAFEVLYHAGATNNIENNIYAVCKLWRSFKPFLTTRWCKERLALIINRLEHNESRDNFHSVEVKNYLINQHLNDDESVERPSIVEDFKNLQKFNSLFLHQTNDLMRNCLSQDARNYPGLVHSILIFIGEGFSKNCTNLLTKTPDELIEHLLPSEIETALALPFDHGCMQSLISTLINEKGYEKTLRLIIAFNNPKIIAPPYSIFIDYGIQEIRFLELEEISVHPFIKSLDLLHNKNLTLNPDTIESLLKIIYSLVLKVEFDFCEYDYMVQEDFRGTDLIEYLFAIITNSSKEFKFDDMGFDWYDDTKSRIIDHYYIKAFQYLLNFSNSSEPLDEGATSVFLDSESVKSIDTDAAFSQDIEDELRDIEALKMIDLEAFIKHLHTIPNTQLKNAVVFKLVEYLYQCCDDSIDRMMCFWPLLNRLEPEFNIQEIAAKVGASYDCTEHLLNLLINDPERLSQELEYRTPCFQMFLGVVKKLSMSPGRAPDSIMYSLPPQLIEAIGLIE